MLITTLILSAVILFLSYDIFVDFTHGASREHLILESTIFSLLVFSALALNHLRYKNDRKLYQNILDKNFEILSLEEKNKKISEALRHLILEQFSKWELTESEVQIAFLIIKGFSLKEIASLRGTSEKTVRDQSSKIYLKTNLSGRAELTAFFLEDLL